MTIIMGNVNNTFFSRNLLDYLWNVQKKTTDVFQDSVKTLGRHCKIQFNSIFR